MKDALTAKSFPRSSIEVTMATSFDARFDAFWSKLVEQNADKLLGFRDRQTLTWHFAGPLRDKQVWILTIERGGLLRAYCVLKRQDHPPSGLVRMRLVDYQSLEPEADLLSPMIECALHRCAAEGVYSLEHVGGDLPKMRAFDSIAPYRRKLPAWPYYYMAADAKLNEQLRDPSAWDPSTFDGDASL